MDVLLDPDIRLNFPLKPSTIEKYDPISFLLFFIAASLTKNCGYSQIIYTSF